MRACKLLATLIVAITGLVLVALPASAQATRTWVSGVGDDANPCSRTAPCKTFAGAISKTGVNGVINTLDPGGYGAVTITKSIALQSEPGAGGILNAGTSGIIINAGASDTVVIDGVTIDGASTGLGGIRILQARSVLISNCIIRTQAGSPGTGINVAVTSPLLLTIRNCNISNVNIGIQVASSVPATGIQVFVENTSISRATSGIIVDGVGATVRMSNSSIAGVGTGLSALNSGKIVSYGNNVIWAPGTPTSTLPLQ